MLANRKTPASQSQSRTIKTAIHKWENITTANHKAENITTANYKAENMTTANHKAENMTTTNHSTEIYVKQIVLLYLHDAAAKTMQLKTWFQNEKRINIFCVAQIWL